jgi:hypothetical protein
LLRIKTTYAVLFLLAALYIFFVASERCYGKSRILEAQVICTTGKDAAACNFLESIGVKPSDSFNWPSNSDEMCMDAETIKRFIVDVATDGKVDTKRNKVGE